MSEEVELVITGTWLTVLQVGAQRTLQQRPLSRSELALMVAVLYSLVEWMEPNASAFMHLVATPLLAITTVRNQVWLLRWAARTIQQRMTTLVVGVEEGRSNVLARIGEMLEWGMLLLPAYVHVWYSESAPPWYLALYVVLFPHVFP